MRLPAIRLQRYLPILDWARTYDRATLTSDVVAAIIVTIMLIPQSLAYAMLAGLPPEIGLYASILPLVAYALFGTSRTLAVGPVAVVSLMTASAVGQVAAQGAADHLTAAIVLALLSGIMLVLMGLLRLGFLANFLSHPVISGFITASGILIAASQLKHILGVAAGGDTLLEMITALAGLAAEINPYTVAVGVGALAFLYFARTRLKPLLIGIGVAKRVADLVTKTAPILAVVVTILLAVTLDLAAKGVALVGSIPQGLPALGFPRVSFELIMTLGGCGRKVGLSRR